MMEERIVVVTESAFTMAEKVLIGVTAAAVVFASYNWHKSAKASEAATAAISGKVAELGKAPE